ncbi:hypothetical protein O7627_24460 [Solwaraspora sp. WMMD1047]|uniref:hypothetical protein n=1 Tax=Solwaraspora sp. WMMD1047 TaxID=3016102 RepID=UPI002417837B|nr:hypothetical protein [Solwaraspora sp. WMMD1047]MDG4832437.1 hypothetical protein [Solwaraspora sp. WMMD1047]
MAWYLAPSLAVLRSELDQRWPRRDRTSDGTIGDEFHTPPSDHIPNGRESVNALDVDADGIDFGVVFAAIKRHPSARYLIYRHRLYHRLRGWREEPYSGKNPHTGHFHLSIDQSRTAEQDRRPWGLATPEEELDMDKLAELEALARLDLGRNHGWRVRDETWQRAITDRLDALMRAGAGESAGEILARIDQRAAELAAGQARIRAEILADLNAGLGAALVNALREELGDVADERLVAAADAGVRRALSSLAPDQG